jgi:photosystem II stability/assembly factor-like uncharacterized protein
MNRNYVLLTMFVLLIACTPIRAQQVQWEQPYDLAIRNMKMAIDSGGVIYALGDPIYEPGTPPREGWTFNRSTDNGTTWSGNNNLPTYYLLFALACDGPGSLYAGASTGLFHSTDSGTTWSQVTTVGWHVMGLGVGPGGTLLAGTGDGVVYRSTDRGSTWESDTVEPGVNVFKFVFAGDGSIVLATSRGVYRSTDDGLSWNLPDNGIDPPDPAQWWEKPALVVAPWGDLYVSYLATIYRSADNGKNWEKMEQTWPGRVVTSILATDQGEMFLGTGPNGGVLRSTDRGQSWKQTAQNLTAIDPGYMPVNVTEMFMTRSGMIVAATDSASVIRTVGSDVAGVSESIDAGEKQGVVAAVLPNPATTAAMLQVTLPHAGELRAELVNSYGETVGLMHDGAMAGGRHSLPLQFGDLPQGVYLLRVMLDGDGVATTLVRVMR